jgi:hypothetical protein
MAQEISERGIGRAKGVVRKVQAPALIPAQDVNSVDDAALGLT